MPYIDVFTAGKTAPGYYTVVLIGHGHGAAPKISEITWPDLRKKLESVFAFHPQTLDNYEKQLNDFGRIVNIELRGSLTQLRAVGFEGLE